MVVPLRKCAIASLAFSAAVFACAYLLPLAFLPWLAAAFALLGFLLVRSRQRWLLGFTIAFFALSCGFLWFFLHAQMTMVPAAKLDGETLQIRGEVCDYPQVYEDYSRLELRLSSGELPKGKLILYVDGDSLKDFVPGDVLSCTAKLKRADIRYGERYDSYFSRGIYLTGNAKDPPAKCGEISGLRCFPVRFQRMLADRVDRLFPVDTAAFMKSLMLGDKSDLYQDQSLYLAMNRAGFLHVVAVSGMHVAFLVGLIQLLLGKSWRSSLVCLVLVWLFVAVTGAAPSAVRAAVMQSFLLAAPMVNRENDPATSLSAALALILLSNPFAAGSIGLQLSFSAMAGVLCLSEPLSKSISSLFSERWASILHGPISIAAGSLAVLAFSVPFMVWHFRSVSLFAPLTNILGLWAVSFCFVGGYLSCFFSLLFLPLGTAAAWLVSWIARYLFFVARLVSAIPSAMLYLRSIPSYLWVLLVYALAAVFTFSRLRTWLKLVMPLLLAVLMLALMLASARGRYRSGDGVIAVMDVGQGQSIAVLSGEETLVIDCGGIYSLENVGEVTGSYLLSCGRDHIDALYLTHLHADHCNGVTMLMEMLPVRQLYLAEGMEDEDGLLEEILTASLKHGTQVVFLDRDAELSFDKIRLRLFMPFAGGSVNERCMTGVISIGSYDMLFTGDSSKTVEKELLSHYSLRDLELLIVGHHGSRYASSGELLRSIGAHTAVVSVGYNNFGHPTHEVLERLAAYGYTIYRTDQNGTIEIFLGKQNG